jgi:hypothetical protein
VTYTNPNTPPERPVHETHVTDNRGSNTTAWVVAALVAVVAIIAVAFMVTNRQAEPDQTQIAQAIDQGRAEGMLAGAQATIDSARVSADAAAASTAAQAQAAAEAARQSADQAARSAETVASDAGATVSAPPPSTSEEPIQ